ncbi:hypothetical protein LOTGIDRAFT_227988 [Lottia gigantea]|uniref:Uncharacterized protein n=1 Tax=Lottia gigantea TaxID=225164 RepID=V4CS90_LOTGI|nr:hypothetical protein LOTGIDRAFT_227988 [Lottia gigantea]ESP05365.1 hypothetical protein LOTGIDRAFT_227988 [Lottia gigantea]
MELGLGFEDEDFEQNNKAKEPIISYNAKFCYSKWFNDNEEIEKAADKSQIYKFSADSFYYNGDYTQALKKYQLCKGLIINIYCRKISGHHLFKDFLTIRETEKSQTDHLPYELTPVWRDVVESIARCYLNLHQFDKSERIARHLLEKSEYIIFKRQSLTLLYDIQSTRNDDMEDQIETLQSLLQLDCCYAPYWYKLYHLYRKQHELSPPAVSNSKYSYPVKAATCLVRARFLRRALHNQACDIVTERNSKILIEIEKYLEELNITIEIINTIRSWMLSTQQEENEENTLENICENILSGRELEEKWFGWSQNSHQLPEKSS